MKNISITLLIITLVVFMGMTLSIVSIEVVGVLAMTTFIAFWLWFVAWLFLFIEGRDKEKALHACKMNWG